MQKKPKLYIPGPTHVQDEVLSSLSDYPIGHRSKEFSILYEEIMKPLSKLLFTTNRIYLSTSSATGLWEAAVRNSVKSIPPLPSVSTLSNNACMAVPPSDFSAPPP